MQEVQDVSSVVPISLLTFFVGLCLEVDCAESRSYPCARVPPSSNVCGQIFSSQACCHMYSHIPASLYPHPSPLAWQQSIIKASSICGNQFPSHFVLIGLCWPGNPAEEDPAAMLPERLLLPRPALQHHIIRAVAAAGIPHQHLLQPLGRGSQDLGRRPEQDP